jgi:hypothetical protein
MNTSTLATNLDALTLDQLDTVSGGSFWSRVRPVNPGGSQGTTPPPFHFPPVPGPFVPGPTLHPPMDPGCRPAAPFYPQDPILPRIKGV